MPASSSSANSSFTRACRSFGGNAAFWSRVAARYAAGSLVVVMLTVLNRLGGPAPTRIAGFRLGMGGWRYRPGDGRVLLVGDAARVPGDR